MLRNRLHINQLNFHIQVNFTLIHNSNIKIYLKGISHNNQSIHPTILKYRILNRFNTVQSITFYAIDSDFLQQKSVLLTKFFLKTYPLNLLLV